MRSFQCCRIALNMELTRGMAKVTLPQAIRVICIVLATPVKISIPGLAIVASVRNEMGERSELR
jgi:hypothetical protein